MTRLLLHLKGQIDDLLSITTVYAIANANANGDVNASYTANAGADSNAITDATEKE